MDSGAWEKLIKGRGVWWTQRQQQQIIICVPRRVSDGTGGEPRVSVQT